ncbi:hypothetical protein KZZ10_07225 [Alcaligenaceae bacterium LF4-65]|uniref:Uncharacterized protein n=1 Tax=Zwartia hollandica TaxID=324606 RepID=A0A953T2J0_9BURK|nr:DUF6776 family protein [Zwartia hollandica]MBZ1350435.1 hypothetical protein [Zwartia hollandica]
MLLIAAGAAAGIFFTQRPSAEDVVLHLRTERLAQATIRGELETQIREAQIRNEHLRNELTIERSARAQLEKNLAQLQVELGRSKDHLAFYEQLLPPGPQGSVALRAVELERNGANLNYRVLLMRSGKPGERVNARLQFVAAGMLGDKETEISLLPRQAVPDPNAVSTGATPGVTPELTDSLKLSFEQFQRSQGVLAVPSDMKVTFVTVQVLDGDIVLASRRVDLQ